MKSRMKRKNRIQKVGKAMETMIVRCEYLKDEKDKVKKPECCMNTYMEKQLAYIEGNLKNIQAEIMRIRKAEIEHEMVFVEVEPGKYKLFDFMTGILREVQTLSMDELHDYINRRAGYKIY
ncbi:hypothetical protein IMSAGC020_02363 [Lachnospiraceae bacterium]|nr:hypothetical protein IMSAGC020_02363 [Lachnospiraceae bacterium]